MAASSAHGSDRARRQRPPRYLEDAGRRKRSRSPRYNRARPSSACSAAAAPARNAGSPPRPLATQAWKKGTVKAALPKDLASRAGQTTEEGGDQADPFDLEAVRSFPPLDLTGEQLASHGYVAVGGLSSYDCHNLDIRGPMDLADRKLHVFKFLRKHSHPSFFAAWSSDRVLETELASLDSDVADRYKIACEAVRTATLPLSGPGFTWKYLQAELGAVSCQGRQLILVPPRRVALSAERWLSPLLLALPATEQLWWHNGQDELRRLFLPETQSEVDGLDDFSDDDGEARIPVRADRPPASGKSSSSQAPQPLEEAAMRVRAAPIGAALAGRTSPWATQRGGRHRVHQEVDKKRGGRFWGAKSRAQAHGLFP